MVITLGPDLESALNDLAKKQSVAPEVLALNALRERILAPALQMQPRDEWERRLLGLPPTAAWPCRMRPLAAKGFTSNGPFGRRRATRPVRWTAWYCRA